MSDLANQAIDALAAIRAIEPATDHPMRHQVRAMKRMAEEALSSAFRQAHGMAIAAEAIVSDYDGEVQKGGQHD